MLVEIFLFAAVDHCLSSPCKNGATCTRHLNTYVCKCPPGFHGSHCDKGRHSIHSRNLYEFPTVDVLGNTVVFPSQQFVRPLTVAATETEDVNISAEIIQIVLTCVSVLQDTVWIRTTAPAYLQV